MKVWNRGLQILTRIIILNELRMRLADTVFNGLSSIIDGVVFCDPFLMAA